MANKVLSLELDNEMIENAETVLEEIGLDVSTYIRIALLKLIKEQRVPFNLSANQSSGNPVQMRSMPEVNPYDDDAAEVDLVRNEPRQMIKITSDMCQSIWIEFKTRIASRDINWQESAHRISTQTGMSRGSAFIYFTILNNLVSGAQNTRSLKMEDLEFFIGKIRSELPEQMLQSAIISLEASIPYWDEKLPGAFAAKVQRLVDKLKDHKD
jgi:addiction module RelB/DinJ family antitoxin